MSEEKKIALLERTLKYLNAKKKGSLLRVENYRKRDELIKDIETELKEIKHEIHA
jgi:hypothetical protein